MSNEEKQSFQDDLDKFSKLPTNNSKVAAFFNNFDQEIDDSPNLSPMKGEELKDSFVLSPQLPQKVTLLDPINPRK